MKLGTDHLMVLVHSLFIIIFACLLCPISTLAQTKYEVYIKNGMPLNSKVPLISHCKSKDDDLGIHKLGVGEVFHFGFKINFWGTTLFFCRMTWGAKDTTIDVFRANKEGAECEFSGQCFWAVKEDGFYFAGDDPPLKKRYSWP